MGDHEIDCLGSHILSGHDQIALVFPILFVDQYYHAARPQLCHDIGNRGDIAGWRDVGMYIRGMTHDYMPGMLVKDRSF
jgi:hypothetical protein